MLTSTQAAERIHRTPDALCKAAQEGRIKATKFGRAWMFEEADVDAYAAAEKSKGGRPKGSRTMQPMTDAEITVLNAAYEVLMAEREAVLEADPDARDAMGSRVDNSPHIVTADVAREHNLDIARHDDQSGILYHHRPTNRYVYGWESGGFSAPNE